MNQLVPVIKEYVDKIGRQKDLRKNWEVDIVRLKELDQNHIPTYKVEIGRLKLLEQNNLSRINSLERILFNSEEI